MKSNTLNYGIFVVVATAMLSIGFVQPSAAGVVSTEVLIQADSRQDAMSRLEATLLRQDVAEQLVEHGVEPATVLARVESLTTDELIALDGQISDQVAGGSAVGILGAVFLVLIVLELVGITDIFKKL